MVVNRCYYNNLTENLQINKLMIYLSVSLLISYTYIEIILFSKDLSLIFIGRRRFIQN